MVFLALGLALPAFAVKETNPGQQVKQQVQEQKQSTTSPSPQKDQEEDEEQEEEQEESSEPTATAEGEKNSRSKKPNPRSETAREHMSLVAQKVEELLAARTIKGGLGEQVRQIAQEQKQNLTQTQDGLNKLEARGELVKKLFGPDYKAIKNLNQQIEQNRLRISQLEQLKNQVQNQADKSLLQEAIEAFIAQNTALEEVVQSEENTSSLLGWLFKLLAK